MTTVPTRSTAPAMLMPPRIRVSAPTAANRAVAPATTHTGKATVAAASSKFGMAAPPSYPVAADAAGFTATMPYGVAAGYSQDGVRQRHHVIMSPERHDRDVAAPFPSRPLS